MSADIIKLILAEDNASEGQDTAAAARQASEIIRALLAEDSTAPHLTITSPRGITSYG